ncbi:MAG: hypothetical protein Q9197_003951 [Variospora fuerteventurae]
MPLKKHTPKGAPPAPTRRSSRLKQQHEQATEGDLPVVEKKKKKKKKKKTAVKDANGKGKEKEEQEASDGEEVDVPSPKKGKTAVQPATKDAKGKRKEKEEQAPSVGAETDVPVTKKGKATAAPKVDAPKTKGKGKGKGTKRQRDDGEDAPERAAPEAKKQKTTLASATPDQQAASGSANAQKDKEGTGKKVTDPDEQTDPGPSKSTSKKTHKPPPIKTTAPNTAAQAPLNLHFLHRVAPAAHAQYPSPYVNTEEIWSIDTEPSVSTLENQAFTMVQWLDRPRFDAWSLGGGVAFAKWYRRCDTGPQFVDGQMRVRTADAATWIGEYGQISWDDLVFAAQPGGGRCEANTPDARRAIEVFREGRGQAAKFFMVWKNDGGNPVRVNGQLCETPEASDEFFAVGPLPSYAIIEVEETLIFWFGNRGALDYETPGILDARKQRRIEEDVGDLFNEDVIGTSPDPELKAAMLQKEKEEEEKETEAAKTDADISEKEENRRADGWQRILVRGMARHSDAYKADPGRSKFHHVKYSSMVEDIDVVLCIASVWDPLRAQGRHFAFNEANNYQNARFQTLDAQGRPTLEVRAAVHTESDLMIPMVLDNVYQSPVNSARPNPANGPAQRRVRVPFVEGTNPNPHTLLAFVENKEDEKVNIIILDSRPGTKDPSRILESILKTICHIGWKDRDVQGVATPLDMEPPCTVERPIVPAQEGIDACGIYVIFNAWVHMLGLPRVGAWIRPRYNRKYICDEDGFLQIGMRIVNLALSGHMDLLTIQAFLNYYGYCKLQDPDGANIFGGEIPTTQMTPDGLNELLEVQRAIEQMQLADRQAVSRRTGCSLDVARLFLDQLEGDVDGAVALYRATYPDTTSSS